MSFPDKPAAHLAVRHGIQPHRRGEHCQSLWRKDDGGRLLELLGSHGCASTGQAKPRWLLAYYGASALSRREPSSLL